MLLNSGSTSAEPDASYGVANFASLTFVALVLDRLFALALTALMSATFGVREELDTYLLAIACPALLAATLGEVIYSLFLPEFVGGWRGVGKTDECWNIAACALTALALITGLYMACWAAGVSVVQPGREHGLLLELGLLLSPLIFFGGVGSLGATMLIAQRRYVAASLRIPVASLTTVASFLILSRINNSIEVLAISVNAGSLIAALMVSVHVLRTFGRPSITISWAWSAALVHRLGSTSIAQATSAVLAQLATPIERLVGFGLGAGVISSLNYGRVLATPPLLIGSSIATASYPRFVAMKVENDPRRYDTLGRSLGMVAFLLAPFTLVLMGVAAPLVRFVYHHGAFDEHAVTRTTVAATILAVALIPSAVGAVLTRFLYAEGDADKVAWASITTLVIYAVGAIIGSLSFGYIGLAVASAGSYLLLMGLLMAVVASRSPRGLRFLPGRSFAQTALASAPTGTVILAVATAGQGNAGGFADLGAIVIASAVGFGVYILCALMIRTPELGETLALTRRLVLGWRR